MDIIEMTCQNCLIGCILKVKIEDEKVVSVMGNMCKRGEKFGKEKGEASALMLLVNVKVNNGDMDIVPVKTETEIPKEKYIQAYNELKELIIEAPLSVGDIVKEDISGTGVNVISTRKINRKN